MESEEHSNVEDGIITYMSPEKKDHGMLTVEDYVKGNPHRSNPHKNKNYKEEELKEPVIDPIIEPNLFSHLPNSLFNKDGRRIRYCLSLDGGGIRGAITASFLSEMERDLGINIFDKFDVFSGTSIGSIIAGGLCVRKLKAYEIIEIFNEDNANEMMPKSIFDRLFGIVQFRPKYNGKGKRKIIDMIFADAKMTESDKMFVVPAYEVSGENKRLQVFTNEHDIEVADVVDASSAAPTYFPSVSFEDGRVMIDGGVNCNDPSLYAYTFAKQKYPNDEIRVLSVGTGRQSFDFDGKSTKWWGGLQWGAEIMEILMDETPISNNLRFLLGNRYLKVNQEIDGSMNKLDNTSSSNLRNLKMLGKDWWVEFGARVKELLNE